MKLWPNKKEKIWPKEGEDYIFVDNTDQHQVTSIRIKKGEFKGVLYHYGKVGVVEDDPPRIKFDYFIDESGEFEFDDLISNEKFDILMGDILVSIFDNNVLKRKKQLDDTIRTNNPEKLDLQ